MESYKETKGKDIQIETPQEKREQRQRKRCEAEREMNSFISVFLRSSLPWGVWPRRTPRHPRASKLFRTQRSSLYSGAAAALGFIICSFISEENAVMFDHLSCNFSSGSSSITVPGPPLQCYLCSNQRKPKCAQLGSFCSGAIAPER